MRYLAQLAVLGVAMVAASFVMAADIGTAFTYQGSLEGAGGPLTGTCDFRFQLYDAAAGGNLKGTNPQDKAGVSVSAGVFTVPDLDFGPDAIDGTARWLEVSVCCPNPCVPAGLVPLTPRVVLRPAPHALALPGLITKQNPTSPTLIGGYAGNDVPDDVAGATICGGGWAGQWNGVFDDFGVVVGGGYNFAGNDDDDPVSARYAFVGGGALNNANATYSTVGGGFGNDATGGGATVCGGESNQAGGGGEAAFVGGGKFNAATGSASTVAGGWQNTAATNYSTVPGGLQNVAGGDYSFAAGRRAKVRDAATAGDVDGDQGTFVWADSTDADFPSTGPNQFLIRAAGGVGIGTPCRPDGQLHVNGSLAIGGESPSKGIAFGPSSFGISLVGLVPDAAPPACTDMGSFALGSVFTATHKFDLNGPVRFNDFGGVTLDVQGETNLANVDISADLTIDTNTLVVDAATNAVGIGTDSPARPLHVLTGGDFAARFETSDTNAAVVEFKNSSSSTTWEFAVAGTSPPFGLAAGSMYLLRQGAGAPAISLPLDNRVGIGTTAPVAQLDVVASSTHGIQATTTTNDGVRGLATAGAGAGVAGFATAASVFSAGYFSNTAGGRGLFVGGLGEFIRSGATVATFERGSNDGTVIEIKQAGTTEGTISVTGTTVSYNAFTGSHYAWTDDIIERGMLVVMTGDNRLRHQGPGAEPIYGISTSSTMNDSACLGAYLGLLEPAQPASNDNPHQIMAVGNGDMWVVETGIDIAPGDFLISSDVIGHAMLDNADRFPIGYIVARAGELVDWSHVSSAESIHGRKHQRISVFFESFERRSTAVTDRKLMQVEAELDSLSRENMDLNVRLTALESSAGGNQTRAGLGTTVGPVVAMFAILAVSGLLSRSRLQNGSSQ